MLEFVRKGAWDPLSKKNQMMPTQKGKNKTTKTTTKKIRKEKGAFLWDDGWDTGTYKSSMKVKGSYEHFFYYSTTKEQ